MGTLTITRFRRTADGRRVWDGEPVTRLGSAVEVGGWAAGERFAAEADGYAVEMDRTDRGVRHVWLRHPSGAQLHLRVAAGG